MDFVARQPDHALDVISLVVARQLEYDDITALRLLGPDAAGEQIEPEGEGIAAIAVAIFRHEQIVADEQRRDHRARGNIEGLKEENPHDQREDQRVNDDADSVSHAASRFPVLGLYAHAEALLGFMAQSDWLRVKRPYSLSLFVRQTGQSRSETFTAEMMTIAWAVGKSSVIERSMRTSWPSGVSSWSARAAPPVSCNVGRPDGKFTTPMSRQKTPWRKPVPSALAQASLAAKRLA